MLSKYINEYRLIEELQTKENYIDYLSIDKYNNYVILRKFSYNFKLINNEQKTKVLRNVDIHLNRDNLNILGGIKYFENNNFLYLVLEYHKNAQTLQQRIDKNIFPNIVEVVQIGLQLCQVLKYLHSQNILHNTLDPTNILIDNNTNIFLTDFTYSTYNFEAKKADIKFTPYTAPEILFFKENTNYYSDLFSVGVILYQLLTGSLPYNTLNKIDYETTYKEFTPIHKINPYVHSNLEAIIHKAIDKDINNRFQNANEMYSALYKIFNEPDIYFCEGNLREKIGDIEGAKHFYNLAITKDESHISSWSKLGELYLIDHDLINAKNAFLRVIRLDNSKESAFYQLGNINYQLKAYDEAIKMYTKAYEYSPKKEYELKIAHTLISQNKHKEAIEHYQNIITKYPDWEVVYYELGDLYYKLDEKELALKNFQLGLQKNITNKDILHKIGLIYLEKKDFVSAICIYQRILTLDPESIEAKYRLAYAYYEINDLDKAINCLEELILIKPDLVNANLLLAYIFEKVGNLKQAEEQYKHVLILDSGNIESYLQLSSFYRRHYKIEEAIDILEEYAKKFAPNIDIFYPLAILYSEKGEYEVALKLYESCLKLTTNSDKILNIKHQIKLLLKNMDNRYYRKVKVS